MSQPIPNLFIAGVHKAGTTSMFTYLSKHPEVCGSAIKETGYFMPLRDNLALAPLEEYLENFRNCKNEKYRMEATPSYLYGGSTIGNAIHQLSPSCRVIIMLREPVDRLDSFYHHIKSKAIVSDDVSLEKFISDSLENLDEGTNDYFNRGVKEGIYAEHLNEWFKIFHSQLKVIYYEDLKKNAELLTKDVCKWLEIDPDILSSDTFTIENKTVYYNNKSIHKAALFINKSMESFWRRNHTLKKKLRNFYYHFNAAEKKEFMPDDIKSKLRNFYEPHNKQLKQVLLNNGVQHFPAWLQ